MNNLSENQETSRRTPPLIPTAGVSLPIKVAVIGLTVVTVIAFAVFAVMLAKKLAGSPPDSKPWTDRLVSVAEKLEEAGLPQQALQQYEKFLESPKIDLETRARVSHKVGELYIQGGNCEQALAWLYQSQAAFPDAPWADEVNQRIGNCLTKIKP